MGTKVGLPDMARLRAGTRLSVLLAALAGAVACGEVPPAELEPQTEVDAGAEPDGGAPVDGGASDGGQADAGPVDAGPVDAGPVDAGPPLDPRPLLATDVVLDDVALFQSIRSSLAAAGRIQPRPTVPVLVGKTAVLRVGVKPASGFVARELEAELVLEDGTRPPLVLSRRQRITGAWREDSAATLFSFAVPAEWMLPSTRWSVRVIDPLGGVRTAAGTSSSARIPADGSSTPLGALDDARGLKLVLVPMRWDSDSSGRLPDTSTAQLDRIRRLLGAMYPVVNLQLTVHAPVSTRAGYTFGGSIDFSSLNDQLRRLRQSERAADDEYWYGLVASDETFSDYCGGSCVTGQSYVAYDVEDAEFRVGSGRGWSGDDSAETLAHELGHASGREHAPCGTRSYDSAYPYRGGVTNVWGFDVRGGRFLPPTFTDFMGYCDDTWVSDYTYLALFNRIRELGGARPYAASQPTRWLPLDLDGLGTPVWRAPLTLKRTPGGPRLAVRWLDRKGRLLGTDGALRMPLGHDGSEELLLPEPPAGAISFELDRGAGLERRALP